MNGSERTRYWRCTNNKINPTIVLQTYSRPLLAASRVSDAAARRANWGLSRLSHVCLPFVCLESVSLGDAWPFGLLHCSPLPVTQEEMVATRPEVLG